ncbi:CHRD domain-containing protein [Solitalea koreensis]|uniref:CHRD domain-containing protein n=1 Tax=Solitalea koreensis TaxID=543615 RepID=A0A521CBJ1_9SPHI|nr:CHRD domain-containing protein [Solitalea koreensis]SMO56130.1 CHRD domain-containing protein [Solitalea koreensis]
MKKTINFFESNARLIAFIAIVALSSLLACSSNNNDMPTPTVTPILYSATFVKTDANVITSATGTFTSTLDPSTRVLTYTVTWSNLTGNPIEMHFHDAGPIIIPVTGFTSAISGSYSGTATFTAEQVVDLGAGKIYFNIHTPNYPSGEILAALTTTGGTPAPGTPGY